MTTVSISHNVLRKRQHSPLGTASKGSLGIMISSHSSTSTVSSIDSLVDYENICIGLQRNVESMDRQFQLLVSTINDAMATTERRTYKELHALKQSQKQSGSSRMWSICWQKNTQSGRHGSSLLLGSTPCVIYGCVALYFCYTTMYCTRGTSQ